jgi:valyl-tRNA synthetase
LASQAGLSGVSPDKRTSISIHTSSWPRPDPVLEDAHAIELGEILVEIASTVRRYKSENNLPLGSELDRLQLACSEPGLAQDLEQASTDLMSVCRVRQMHIDERLGSGSIVLKPSGKVAIAVIP